MMFRKMQDAGITADLHVERQARLEPVLPVDREAEVVDVEPLRQRLVEAAEDGDWWLHRVRDYLCSCSEDQQTSLMTY